MIINLLTFLLGTRCRDCGERHRSDFCPACYERRLLREDASDRRTIAHVETEWPWRKEVVDEPKPKRTTVKHRNRPNLRMVR